jgi:squalene-associated FAD-dependent desaturase
VKVLIIGGGWAGLAAAVEAVRRGHAVTLLEAAPTLGGRARGIDLRDGERDLRLDNGQHILIGAYTECLRLMQTVGVDPGGVFDRRTLTLRFADGGGLVLPRLPAPFDALLGILGARQWTWTDRLALLGRAARWQRHGFQCPPALSVAALCAGLPARVLDELIDPLCVSALNTPAAEASGSVFLRVLRDAMFGEPGGSHLLLPRVDLGALFPLAAARWLADHGATVRTHARATQLARAGSAWRVDDGEADAVILAGAAWDARRLVQAALPDDPAAARWCAQADSLRHTAIATVYVQAERGLEAPLLALRARADAPAQFVFDRGALGGPAGLLAFVVSASGTDREALGAAVLGQARRELAARELGALRLIQVVVEKRATFACTPGLQRPPAEISHGLLACGDYIDGPYPATLEGAVRSGVDAIRRLGPVPSSRQ